MIRDIKQHTHTHRHQHMTIPRIICRVLLDFFDRCADRSRASLRGCATVGTHTQSYDMHLNTPTIPHRATHTYLPPAPSLPFSSSLGRLTFFQFLSPAWWWGVRLIFACTFTFPSPPLPKHGPFATPNSPYKSQDTFQLQINRFCPFCRPQLNKQFASCAYSQRRLQADCDRW